MGNLLIPHRHKTSYRCLQVVISLENPVLISSWVNPSVTFSFLPQSRLPPHNRWVCLGQK